MRRTPTARQPIREDVVRNIPIADRKDWVINQRPVAPAPRPSKLRDWLATLPIVLLVPALVLPLVMTAAAGVSLKAVPGSASPGQRVAVVGDGFDSGESGSLIWADPDVDVKTLTADDI